jgi:hypothetical protein
MTVKLKILIGLCLTAALGWTGSATAEPPEPSLQGCWDVAISTPIFVPTIHVRLKLTVRDDALSGTMSKGKWQGPLRATAAQGKRLRFVVDSPRGEARFSGALDGRTLQGRVSGSRGTYSWEGQRCGG